jgi:hypothetical protein
MVLGSNKKTVAWYTNGFLFSIVTYILCVSQSFTSVLGVTACMSFARQNVLCSYIKAFHYIITRNDLLSRQPCHTAKFFIHLILQQLY